MNQNHLLPNGSPSSIIDSFPISNSNAPQSVKVTSSLDRDYVNQYLQSPSTQNTYSSVDANSNSQGNLNSLNVKGFGINDNNYKITTHLVDSIIPGNQGFTSVNQLGQQPQTPGQSSFNMQNYINSLTAATPGGAAGTTLATSATNPYQNNTQLSIANTTVGASFSTSGESPHPEANNNLKAPSTMNFNSNTEGKNVGAEGNASNPPTSSSILTQFFKNQGYSFSTVTSPASNQQPLQSLSFHHQASMQPSSNTSQTTSTTKLYTPVNSSGIKNDLLNKYTKENNLGIPSSTISIQQTQSTPSYTNHYPVHQPSDYSQNSLEQRNQQDLATKQLNDVQRVQQKYANTGLNSFQSQSTSLTNLPYPNSNSLNQLLTPQREVYASGLSQSLLEIGSALPRNTLGQNLSSNKLYHQSSIAEEKQTQQDANNISIPRALTANELIDKYSMLKQTMQPSLNVTPLTNITLSTQPQQLDNNPNGQIGQPSSAYQISPLTQVQQQQTYIPQPQHSHQSSISQTSSYLSTPYGQGISPLAYHQIPPTTESPHPKKYEISGIPSYTMSTPLRKDSAPTTESSVYNNALGTKNIGETNLASPHSGKHIYQKYQSYDQDQIQKALNGIPTQQSEKSLLYNPNYQQQTSSNLLTPQSKINLQPYQSPTHNNQQSSIPSQSYLQAILSPSSSGMQNQKSALNEDKPFQITSPISSNQVISVQKPYLQSINMPNQNNSLTSGSSVQNSNRQSEADNQSGINDSFLQNTNGVQKIPSLSVQSNDLQNQNRIIKGGYLFQEGVEQKQQQQQQQQQQQPLQQNQNKQIFSLYQNIVQGNPNVQKIANSQSFLTPSQPSLKDSMAETQQPSSARGAPKSVASIISNSPTPSNNAQKSVNQQYTYKVTPPSPGGNQQIQNQNNPNNSSSPQAQQPKSPVKITYQIAGNQKPQQTNGLPYNSLLQQQPQQQGLQQVFENGQQIQIPNRPRGVYSLIDTSSHSILQYKNPKQSNNYKQKIWQNILNQRKSKQSSFHSPVREKQFQGLNASADDFSRGQHQYYSPQKKAGSGQQQAFFPNSTQNLSQSHGALQTGGNPQNQQANCIANSKYGKNQEQQQQQQQYQIISYVNYQGQRVEQKVLIKSPPNQQLYNMNNASFPHPTFGQGSDMQNQLLANYPNDENPPKINLEIVNNHLSPNENVFYGDQKAMTFSKISGNSSNSQNSGQNSPAFTNNQMQQKSHSPSGKKFGSSQFAISAGNDQSDPTKRLLKYEQPDNVLGGNIHEIKTVTTQPEQKANNTNHKENLNRAMRMSFGGEGSNPIMTQQN